MAGELTKNIWTMMMEITIGTINGDDDDTNYGGVCSNISLSPLEGVE